MAAGILSIAANSQDELQLSEVLLLVSLVSFGITAARNLTVIVAPKSRERTLPVLILFTWVAACSVLGQRLSSATPYAFSGLALLAVVGMAGAAIALARFLLSPSWPTAWNVNGSWLLAVVAIQSLSIACSSLRNGPLADWALGLWVAGMVTYCFLIILIVRRLVLRGVGLEDLTPDYWIAMGALAISTVAATQIPALSSLAPEVWLAAAAWIPYLCLMEVIGVGRRGLEVRHDVLRWSTVFPLGMFSLATHDLGKSALDPIAGAFLWAGLLVAISNLVAGAWNLRRRGVVS